MSYTKNLNVYTLNAFAKTPDGGNPAGVVLEADGLSDQQMQSVAKEVGFSETAFLQKSDKADFKVRFFTPKGEVDLCGHATIATFSLLFQKGLTKPGKYIQETKAGILDIEVRADGVIMMNQNLPQFFKKINPKEIAESLNIPTKVIMPDLPVQIVSTGLKDILVPIRFLRELISIKPDFQQVAEISKKYNVIGYHLFALETLSGGTAHCRNLAPLYDIPEESATGTSNGALSCYLYKYRKINSEQAGNLVFEQGYSMGKPSEIKASLKIENDQIKEIKVGGAASKFEEKQLVLP